MSECNFKAFKIGQSLTASENFVMQSHDDGTMTLKRGNPGAETDTILTINADGTINVGSLPFFQCRAWAKFDGTGTLAVDASGNVASIVDDGTGQYTVNFTTAMPDANYAVVGNWGRDANGTPYAYNINFHSYTTTSFQINTKSDGNANVDFDSVTFAVFR